MYGHGYTCEVHSKRPEPQSATIMVGRKTLLFACCLSSLLVILFFLRPQLQSFYSTKKKKNTSIQAATSLPHRRNNLSKAAVAASSRNCVQEDMGSRKITAAMLVRFLPGFISSENLTIGVIFLVVFPNFTQRFLQYNTASILRGALWFEKDNNWPSSRIRSFDLE